jgi:hypothetical protein
MSGLREIVTALLVLTPLAPGLVGAQSLRGSAAKLSLQNEMAEEHDFTFLRTPAQVRTFVELGLLVPVRPNADFELHQVSFPYGRPEVSLFVDRLASQYHQACGEKLVVTSLTRPISEQPRNASDRSVHPTGMAVDLRRSNDRRCRSWLENTLTQLDGTGVLDATRESRPPHYHVVIFPKQYAAHVSRLESRFAEAVARKEPAAAKANRVAVTIGEVTTPGDEITTANLAAESAATELIEYTVRRGDSLWTIARRMGTTVERIREENDLRSSRIFAGQVITVPAR